MANLIDTAEFCMNGYYQNHKSDEDFFNKNHFFYVCAGVYGEMLANEYKEARKVLLQEEGFTDGAIDPGWFTEEEAEVVEEEGEYYAQLKNTLFTFPYDKYSYGLQVVRAKGVDFIRTSQRRAWMQNNSAINSKVYYYPIGNRVYFANVYCNIKKVRFSLIVDPSDPQYGEDGGPVNMPLSAQNDLMKNVWAIFNEMRKGVLVNMSNDSNPNQIVQNEIKNKFPNMTMRQ